MEEETSQKSTEIDSGTGQTPGNMNLVGDKLPANGKRSFPFAGDIPSRKMRKTSQSTALKAPLVVLHENIGKVEFDIKPTGKGLTGGFVAEFSYNGQGYVGNGNSKKAAKNEAAKSCLRDNSIPYLEEQIQEDMPVTAGNQPVISNTESFYHFPEGYTDFSLDVPIPKIPQLTSALRNAGVNMQRATESPFMVLNELIPGLSSKLHWVETGSKTKFRCKIILQGHVFEGSGLGKRTAKKKLAKNVLSKLYGVPFPTVTRSISEQDRKASVLGRMHAFARVKHLDPSSKYLFENVNGEDRLLCKAKLLMCGKEYECVCEGKDKAKFKVAKLGLKDNEDIVKSNSTIIERSIDTSKHPFQMFTEYYGSLELVEQELTNEKIPHFLLGVVIDGQYAGAKATSKKRARAKLALKVFERNHGIDINAWSLLKDEIKTEYIAERDYPDPQIETPSLPKNDDNMEVPHLPKSPQYQTQSPGDKNSVSILNELHPEVEFLYTEENFGNNKIQYKCLVNIGEKTYDGTGYSKKSAKLEAARKTLEDIYGIEMSTTGMEIKSSHHQTNISVEFADKVLNAINAKSSSVFPIDVPYKVIASIVMTKEVNGVMIDAFEVLSIATGTKCISGESINCSGQVLNDCHAEVIAGRGLRHFFFDQLHLAADGKESCFQRESNSSLFQMKPYLHLFLYINTAPCGDGRVYSAEVSSSNRTVGMLRTKVENGQGTIPVPAAGLQTTDGILAGERLLTMSCSDKLMKWNILGIQGSILTNFMKPVYLTGLIVGDKYHYEHFTRSLYSRISDIRNLPPPFIVVKPDFGTPSKTESRSTSKATNNSYNWYYGQTTVEVINGVTGKTPVSTPSRLSKSVTYRKYCSLMMMTRIMQPAATYHEAKEQATRYQISKRILFKHLDERGFGKWVGKPAEQDSFH